KNAARYTITLAPFGEGFTASMRYEGRRTHWEEYAPTREGALAKVLAYLHESLRPLVAVSDAGQPPPCRRSSASPRPTAGAWSSVCRGSRGPRWSLGRVAPEADPVSQDRWRCMASRRPRVHRYYFARTWTRGPLEGMRSVTVEDSVPLEHEERFQAWLSA